MGKKFVDFNGHRYTLSGKYYRKNCWSQDGPSNLHRAVWEFHNGPIPEGFEIHHEDENGLNNELSNLMVLPIPKHQADHALARHKSGTLQPPTDKCREKAAEWHRSAEGLAWHKEHGTKTWDTRVWYPCVCQECNQPFMSPYPKQSKFCHVNCKFKAMRRRKGILVRESNRKPRVLSGKRSMGNIVGAA